MAKISTESAYLLYRTSWSGDWTPLIPISEFPDMWTAPDSIDVTTLSDHMQKNIKDIIKIDSLEFSAFYDNGTTITDDDGVQYKSYSEMTALANDTEKFFALAFKATHTNSSHTFGTDGALVWKGTFSAGIKGNGVSSAVEVGLAFYATSEIKWSADLASAVQPGTLESS